MAKLKESQIKESIALIKPEACIISPLFQQHDLLLLLFKTSEFGFVSEIKVI